MTAQMVVVVAISNVLAACSAGAGRRRCRQASYVSASRLRDVRFDLSGGEHEIVAPIFVTQERPRVSIATVKKAYAKKHMSSIMPLAAELSHLTGEAEKASDAVPSFLRQKLNDVCQDLATATSCLNLALQDKNPKAIREVQEDMLAKTVKDARAVADAVNSAIKQYNTFRI